VRVCVLCVCVCVLGAHLDTDRGCKGRNLLAKLAKV
jgi:hypothetical protein